MDRIAIDNDGVGNLVSSLRYGPAQLSSDAADRKAREMLYDEYKEAGVAAWKRFTNERAAWKERYRVRLANNATTGSREAGRGANRRRKQKDAETWLTAVADPDVWRRINESNRACGIREVWPDDFPSSSPSSSRP